MFCSGPRDIFAVMHLAVKKIPLLALWMIPLSAQPQPNVTDIMHRVRKTYDQPAQIDVSLTLTQHDAKGTQSSSSFRFAASLPKRLRIEFGAGSAEFLGSDDLGESLMLIDGQNTWIYSKGYNQYVLTTGSPPDHDGLINPTHDPSLFVPRYVTYFVGGFLGLERDPVVSKIVREETIDANGAPTHCYVIEIQGSSEFRTLWVDKSRYVVLRMDTKDSARGETLSVVFTGVKINEALPEDLFIFTPPQGARKVDKIER